ncbi:hypothetical protein J4406_03065 [Candidatus Woesearchaeota archaeon]|nr:hypothetical protein [Candidatus Woesearchaeota archaeon]
MKGISKKEIRVISDLEFKKIYYFNISDVKNHFKNKRQIINTIYTLRKKGRIVKLNKNKYFLVPIKARTGKWADDSFIIADEVCNGRDYFIGGWAAANYWRLTDQIPMQVDVYTTRRQGKIKILNTRLVFHRTTKKRIGNAVIIRIKEHNFRIQNKIDTKKWMKSRE